MHLFAVMNSKLFDFDINDLAEIRLISPDTRYFSGDAYPDAERYRALYLIDTLKNKATLLANVYSYAESNIDIRCDLHARWNPRGTELSFDSNHMGYRSICVLDIEDLLKGN